MQGDGNFVLYRDGPQAVWSTGTSGGGSRAVLQADGNLLVGNATGVKWTTATDGLAGAVLKLQDDGNVVLYYAGRAVWSQGSGFMGDLLSAQQGLQAGQQVRSRNGRYRLTMQGDGNLVLYRDGPNAVWSSGTGGRGRSQATMQADGNLVVGNSAGPTWSSATSAFDQAALVVQDDGNVVIYHNGHAIWTGGSGYIGDTLGSGATLNPGAFLKSPNRAFTLTMQPDGNLVLYGPGGAVWSFGTFGHPGARAVMQPDGNFVVYSGSNAVASTKTGTPGSVIRVQDDDNLVVYSGSTPLWSRKTPQGLPNADGADLLPVTGSSILISCTFNSPCNNGFHNGGAIDFAVGPGTPVYAAGSGTITAADNAACGPGSTGCNSSRGKWIAINHGGRSSRYLHLSSLVRTGGQVSGGELIGYSGSSGTSNAHLHYDELTNPTMGTGKLDPGTLYACHGSTRASYSNWPALEGARLRNDGYAC